MRYPGFETNVTGMDGKAYRIVEIGSRTLGLFADHVRQADKLDADLSVGYKIGAAAIRVGSDTELKADGGRLNWRMVDPADIHSAIRSDVELLGSPDASPLHVGESDPLLDQAMVERLGGYALDK